jgi:hypothetical protein
MRRVVPALLAPLALGLVTACSGGTGADAAPRDESAFYRWTLEVNVEPGFGDDRAWIFEHRPEVLAEGNRACEWLGQQPQASSRSDDRYSVETLAARYGAATEPIAKVSPSNRGNIAVQAWAHLCEDVRNPRIIVPPDND